MPGQFPDKKSQISEFSDGMQQAVSALGEEMRTKEEMRKTTRFDTKEYDGGVESSVEIWDVTGQTVDLDTSTQSGLFPRRENGTTSLNRELTQPPDRNGRSAIFFDNGKSLFIQDGVAYIFGKSESGESELLKATAIDEISPVKIGSRNSLWVNGIDEKGIITKTEVTGKPIAVAIEALTS